MKGMLRQEQKHGPRLALTLCYYTSEDETYPAAALRIQNKKSCGWQSGKHCAYPQELIFRFDGVVLLDSFRLLAHESKISSCVEVFIAEASEAEVTSGVCRSFDNVPFFRLGHVRLSTNEINRFMARELKTVGVKRKISYLKLVFRRPHHNTYNLFQQVGLVAITAHGSLFHNFNSWETASSVRDLISVGEIAQVPLDEMMPLTIQEANATSSTESRRTEAESSKRIAELQALKARAVSEEDYDLANALKTQIDAVEKASLRIVKLEQEKTLAVQAEDYLKAKDLKRQINELLDLWTQLPAPPRTTTITSSQAPPAVSISKPNSARASPPLVSAARRMSLQPNSYDEQVVGGKGYYDLQDETGGIAASPPAKGMGGDVSAAGNGGTWERLLNIAINREITDQSIPSTLSGPSAAEGALYEKDLGVFAVACLLARRGLLREAAIRGIVSTEGFSALNSHTQTAIETLLTYWASKSHGIGDPVAAVVFASCEALLKILRGKLQGAPSVASLSGNFAKLLPELVSRLGDSNGRIRENIEEVLSTLARSAFGLCTAFARVVDILMVDPDKGKKLASFRTHLSRINLLSTFVDVYGIDMSNPNALDARALLARVVLPGMQHSAGEVREAAIMLFAKLIRLNDHLCRPFLESVKPAQQALVEAQLASETDENDKVLSGPSMAEADLESDTVSVRQPSREGPPSPRPTAAVHAVPVTKSTVETITPAPVPAPAPIEQDSIDPSEPEEVVVLEAIHSSAAVLEESSYVCQFCGEYNETFTEDNLDIHYVRACPMLCPCPLCDQVTEIGTLQQHLVSECEGRSLVRECPRCREAVRAEDYQKHVSAKECIEWTSASSVCPLCHARFKNTMEGWRKHLATSPGCPNNPRRFDGSGPTM